MPYITKSNSKKLIAQFVCDDISLSEIINLYNKKLWMLSNGEKLWIIKAKRFYDSDGRLIEERFVKQKREDTKTYVFEGGASAYHSHGKCDRINSEYINFLIPPEIKERGEGAIAKFREWFKNNRNLLVENEYEKFSKKLQAEFLLVNPPQRIEYENSGFEIIENPSLSNVEFQVNNIINEANIFYSRSKLHTDTIDLVGYKTYSLLKNNTDVDKESIIYIWHHHYKEPLKKKLIDYYRVMFNPDLEFSGELLDALGLIKCSQCYDKNQLNTVYDNYQPIPLCEY